MNSVRVVLTLLPFIWIVGMMPFVNRVRPILMGLPLLAFWLVLGIPVTFICLSILYKIDSKHNGGSK